MSAKTKHSSADALPPRSLAGLWVEMIGPPLIWLTQFQIKYALAGKSFASQHPGWLTGTTVIAATCIIALAIFGWRHRREAAASPLDAAAGVIGRTRFMAMVGMMNCGLFF